MARGTDPNVPGWTGIEGEKTTAFVKNPNGPGGWYVTNKGGILAVGGAPSPQGSGGSYLGLPAEGRQGGERSFNRISADANGVTIFSTNNEGYTFSFAPSRDGVDTLVRQLYGYLAAFLDHPEIGPILRQAANEGWDSARLQGAVYATNWWKTTSEATRQYEVLTSQDPAEARRRVEARSLNVRIEASRLGLNLSEERITAIATNAVRFGWNDAELSRSLASELQYSPDTKQTGDPANFMRRVKEIAGNYMVGISDQAAFEWAKKVAMGEATEESVVTYFVDLAKGRFPHLAKQIDEGITPKQFFDPYIQDTARLLEISPDQVDLANDPRFSPILGVPDKDGIRPMTTSEAQKHVRGLDDWRKTQQAEEQVLRVANGIGKVFGKVA